MKIEIVECYFNKREGRGFSGTMHVYLIEEQIDLRGVVFFSKDGKKINLMVII